VTCLLWLTHVWTPEVRAEFEALACLQGPDMPAVWLLLDARTPGAADLARRYPRCHVFEEEALFRLPYPRLDRGGVWMHCHFPLLEFFLAHPDYEHYWLVEYDVRYAGSWRSLLAAFAAREHDLITSHLRSFADEPGWDWWHTFRHPTRSVPRDQWWRSFNVCYRISRRALAFLHEALADGWRGHPEVLLPTLLLHGGFCLLDLGGDGPFVLPGCRNRVYTSRSTRNGLLSPFATVAFRPSRARVGWRRNKIYHPVKPGPLREPARARWREVLRYARDRVRSGASRR
jgi:Protein of unknown function (DUF3405)